MKLTRLVRAVQDRFERRDLALRPNRFAVAAFANHPPRDPNGVPRAIERRFDVSVPASNVSRVPALPANCVVTHWNPPMAIPSQLRPYIPCKLLRVSPIESRTAGIAPSVPRSHTSSALQTRRRRLPSFSLSCWWRPAICETRVGLLRRELHRALLTKQFALAELFVNYRLNPMRPYPEYYHPIDINEDIDRWLSK